MYILTAINVRICGIRSVKLDGTGPKNQGWPSAESRLAECRDKVGTCRTKRAGVSLDITYHTSYSTFIICTYSMSTRFGLCLILLTLTLNQSSGFVYLLSFQDFIFSLDDFCSMVNAQFIIKMITL